VRRVRAEGTGVTERIEYVAPRGQRRHGRAVVALVEIEAGLLAALDAHLEADRVFENINAVRNLSARHTTRGCQALAHAG
jgi:hypothetical protein